MPDGVCICFSLLTTAPACLSGQVCLEDRSVPEMRQRQTEPIDLNSCLQAFTREEALGEQEKYYCSKCQTHQLALKKLQIWRLPPILVRLRSFAYGLR